MFDADLQQAVNSAAWRYKIDPEELYQDMALALLEKGFTEQTIAAKGGRAYLYKMAQNRAHNLRRKERSLAVDLSETADDPDELGAILSETRDGSIADPEAILVEREDIGKVYEHITSVVASSKYKGVLGAYYLEGLDNQGVAKALGLTPANVRYRLMQARKELGDLDGDLRLWRAYAHPHVKQPDGEATASAVLVNLLSAII